MLHYRDLYREYLLAELINISKIIKKHILTRVFAICWADIA